MADEISIVVRAEDHFSGVLGNFGSIMTGIESAINLAGRAFGFFKDMAMEGLDAIASYERLELSLQSLVAAQMVQAGVAKDVASAMEVAGLKAEELVQWNEQLAINSPFTSEGVAQAFRMAMAYGFTVDEAKRLTEAMIDFAAGSGASEYAMQQIARALGQISATGKLTGGDMLQLVNAGLPVAEILADAFGVTTAEIMEMRTAGLIPAQDAIEAITVYLETNFAGAAERQAMSWAGLMGTFEDLKQMGLREFFGGLFDAIQPLMIQISEWIQGPGLEKLREWGAVLGEMAGTVANIASALIDAGPASSEFRQALGTIFSEDTVDLISRFIEALSAGDWATVWETITEAFTRGWDVVAPAVEEFFINLFNQAEAAINTWVEGGGADRLSRTVVDSFSTTIAAPEFQNKAGQAFVSLLEAGMRAVASMDWSSIGGALDEMFNELFGVNAAREWQDDIRSAFQQIWADIGRGLTLGISWENIKYNISTFVSNVINYFKTLFGISSPSTVFYGIGKDIVQGLINGILSMFADLGSVIARMFDILTGGDGSEGGTAGASATVSGIGTQATGTVGGRDMSLGGLVPASATVNNYYYGPVYFMGAGEPGAYYDCPSPNPLMTSGSRTPRTAAF